MTASKRTTSKNAGAKTRIGRAEAILRAPVGQTATARAAPRTVHLDDTLAPSDGDSGPGDDQYTDLVSVLMEEVGEPDLFKEIDEP